MPRPWTSEEDDFLCAIVMASSSQREGFRRAAKEIIDRTENQCMCRYRRLCRQATASPPPMTALEAAYTTRWHAAERQKLRQGLETYGRDYLRIRARLLPHRPLCQIRARANRLFAQWRATGRQHLIPPVQRNRRRRSGRTLGTDAS